jgi:hypothetical protein
VRQRYGADARAYCIKRAVELAIASDEVGAVTWPRILGAVDALARRMPDQLP